MSSKAVENRSGADTAKLLFSLLLLIAGTVAFYIFSEYSLLMRVLSLIVVAGIAVFVALQSSQGKMAWGFVRDAKTEVRKVVWPTRAETTQTTLVVVVMVLLVAILLWIMDSFLLWAVKYLTGQGD
jgi:preprotein translocase subunit SecE